jgi:hypothetical protein
MGLIATYCNLPRTFPLPTSHFLSLFSSLFHISLFTSTLTSTFRCYISLPLPVSTTRFHFLFPLSDSLPCFHFQFPLQIVISHLGLPLQHTPIPTPFLLCTSCRRYPLPLPTSTSSFYIPLPHATTTSHFDFLPLIRLPFLTSNPTDPSTLCISLFPR